MRKHASSAILLGIIAIAVLVFAPVRTLADNTGAVEGVVKSSSGQPLSGAFVKLRDADKRLTFMVISQAQGKYSAKNLPAGKYTVQGIGNGFQSSMKPVQVANGKATKADLSLTAPQAAELANGWPGRPGKVGGVEIWVHEAQTPLAEGEGKDIIREKCTQCHETERIVLLRFDEAKWSSTVDRMREYKKSAQGYGMAVSGDGRVWFAERDPSKIGRLDPTTGKIDEWDTPIAGSIPRRMGSDLQGNIWVGLHESGKLMKIDYETAKMTLYDPPTKNAAPYDAVGDPEGRVWFSEQAADKITRFDPKTNTFLEFSVPNAESDERRIELDPTNPNRVWWGGDTSSHIGYIEVLGGKVSGD